MDIGTERGEVVKSKAMTDRDRTFDDAQEAAIATDIAHRIQSGDASAEEAFVARYRSGLVFVLRRRSPSAEDAEDIADEALMIVINRLRSSGLDDPAKLGGFLRRTAINVSINERRKEARRQTYADTDAINEEHDADQMSALESISKRDARRAVRQLLDELRMDRDREILFRYHLQEQDKEVICKDLGLDSLQFNRVLFRARERFKEIVLQKQPSLRLIE